MTSQLILETRDLAVGYRPSLREVRTVVEQIDVSLQPGELVCLIGPNGAGKSTLMRTLAGMQPPLAGNVLIAGRDIVDYDNRELAQQLSIVLTERVNVGVLSGYALVALGRHPYTGWSGALSEHDEEIVRRAIEAVDAVDLAHRNVSELSDGERQKIMIARALAQEPALMLLDEPTAYLDLPRRVETMQVLRNLAHKTGRAVLLSTHDLDLALRSADRIWLLPHNGPIEVGAPEDLVLSGAFEAAFHTEGVAFDRETGSFRLQAQRNGEIALSGSGVDAIWTRRALEREGFAVVEPGKDCPHLHVEIIPGKKHSRWRVHRNGSTADYTSLYELVSALHSNSQR